VVSGIACLAKLLEGLTDSLQADVFDGFKKLYLVFGRKVHGSPDSARRGAHYHRNEAFRLPEIENIHPLGGRQAHFFLQAFTLTSEVAQRRSIRSQMDLI
jgi:hypothetical protein